MDIISLPVEIEKTIVDGKYRLTMVASQRAKELAVGAKSKIQTKAKKVTTIALQETIDGKVEYLVGEEGGRQKRKQRNLITRNSLKKRRKRQRLKSSANLKRI